MSEMLKNQGGPDQKISGIPVDRDFIFSNYKSIYKKAIEKRQTKLLAKISFIKPFLSDGERIVLVTTGCSPVSILDHLLTGWIVYYLKRSLFVFTNKRIFHIPTKYDFSYRNSIAQIPYADCEAIEVKRRALVLKYKNGKKEKFPYLPSREKKKIIELLKTTPLGGAQSQAAGRVHLCPCCTKEMPEDNYVCPNCRLEFKNKAEGKKISFLYPGGGYFYTGHPWLGISDAITETILIVLMISALVDTLQGGKDGIVLLIMSALALAFEKVLTVYHANHFIKEYIPKEKGIRPVIAGH